MVYDLQKASFWKRIAAWLFDAIVAGTLAVGLVFLLSSLLGYDGYSQTMNEAYARYEGEYGIVFDISQEDYQALDAAHTYSKAAAAGTAAGTGLLCGIGSLSRIIRYKRDF